MLKKLFRPGVILGLILLLIISSGIISLKNLSQAKAAGAGDVDGVGLHVKYEVSKDHGVTWENYTEDGQTLIVSSGDSVEVRVKVWDTGNSSATDITGGITTTNSSYISSASVISYDADSPAPDSINYTGFFGAGGTSGGLEAAMAGTTEATAEVFTATLQLGNNFPAGQTIITSDVTIDDYTVFEVIARKSSPFAFIGKAHALGVGESSGIAILVNVAAPDLPETGMK